jgi:hypothetical protein
MVTSGSTYSSKRTLNGGDTQAVFPGVTASFEPCSQSLMGSGLMGSGLIGSGLSIGLGS